MAKIEFDNIPTSLRKPGVYTEYNSRNAVTTLPTNESEVLIIAPMTTESVTNFTLPQRIYSDKEAEALFGAGSWAHLMARIAIRNNNLLNLSVMGLKDHSAGVAATATLTFAGTVTMTGVVTAKIGGVDYQVRADKTETEVAVANRLMAVINSTTDCPVKATLNEKVLTLTAKCKGEIGNELTLATQVTAEGLTITSTAFDSGATNAELAPALASIAGTHYQIIVSPFTDDKNAKALKEHLVSVSSPTEDKPGIGVMGWRGTMAAGTTFTEKLNSERITVGWYKGSIEANALIAAGYAAIIAKEEDPARPLNTLEILGLTEVDATQTPLLTEVNQALFHGLTPITVVNHTVQIMRALTTYMRNPTGEDDIAYLDLTTIRSLDYVRKSIQQRIRLRFPREKLLKRTEMAVRSEILDVLRLLEELEVVENVQKNKDKLLVQRNIQDPNRLDTAIPSDVVNGLHVVANRIDLIL